MSIIDSNSLIINERPLLNLASFGSNEQIITVDLVQRCRSVVKHEWSLDMGLPSIFQVDHRNIDQFLVVARHSHQSSRSLHNKIADLSKFYNSILLACNSVTEVLFDNLDLCLLRDIVTILVLDSVAIVVVLPVF